MSQRVVVDKVKTSVHVEEIACPEFDVPGPRLLLQRSRGDEGGGGYINSNSVESQLSRDCNRIIALSNPVAPWFQITRQTGHSPYHTREQGLYPW